MKSRIGGRLMLISLFFALLTCATLYWYLQGITAKGAAGGLTGVVVVKKAVPANREVKAEFLEIKKMPHEYIPPTALNSISQAVGKVTLAPLSPGEILCASQLARKKADVGLAFLIPQGERAITIAVNEVSGVAQLIKPGNYVDVLVFLDKETAGTHTEATLLQKKRVLAVDQKLEGEEQSGNSNSTEDRKEKGMQTVTIAVSPAEAQELALAQEIGSVRLILRPQEDTSVFQGKGVSVGEILQ